MERPNNHDEIFFRKPYHDSNRYMFVGRNGHTIALWEKGFHGLANKEIDDEQKKRLEYVQKVFVENLYQKERDYSAEIIPLSQIQDFLKLSMEDILLFLDYYIYIEPKDTLNQYYNEFMVEDNLKMIRMWKEWNTGNSPPKLLNSVLNSYKLAMERKMKTNKALIDDLKT